MERVGRLAAAPQEHSPEPRGTRQLRELRERCPVQSGLLQPVHLRELQERCPVQPKLLQLVHLPAQPVRLPEEDPLRVAALSASH